MARAWVSWSSGKDSAWALHVARRMQDLEVVGLLTTVLDSAQSVAMHHTPRAIVQAQADAIGLALHVVELPPLAPNEVYEARMQRALAEAQAQGITHAVFGDLFLDDVRSYRETLLAHTGTVGVYPLWHRPTAALAREMIADGLKAVVVSVDPERVPGDLCGRAYDRAFLAALPPGVDPCGENGEFHTLVWDGPMFARPLRVTVGEPHDADHGLVAVPVRLGA